MPDARHASRAPWIIAGAAGVVFVVLLVVYFIPLAHARDSAGPGQLSRDEQLALNAAATETANLTTRSRGHYAQDYARALAGATGGVKSDLVKKKAATLKFLTTNKFDLSGKVTHEALVGPNAKGDGYVVLVTVDGYKSTAPNTPVQSNLQVTVVHSGAKYLVSDLQSIGVN